MYHSLCGLDLPHRPVTKILDSLKQAEFEIILLTGRPEKYRKETICWLADFGIPFDLLIMQADNNTSQPSAEFKHEVYEALQRDCDHKIVAVFEDRQKIVDMWRKNNVFVFQCGKGDL